MGRYFGHTYNLPMYRFPANGGVPRPQPGEPSFIGRHQLFDLETDPRQENPVCAPDVEARFVERIKHHLQLSEAPEEQYQRLGVA
jgi:hypothetical protein